MAQVVETEGEAEGVPGINESIGQGVRGHVEDAFILPILLLQGKQSLFQIVRQRNGACAGFCFGRFHNP